MSFFKELFDKIGVKKEENLTLKKICELSEIDLPAEYAEYGEEVICHLVFDVANLRTLEDDTAVFMFSDSPADDKRILVKAGAENKKVYIFGRKQIPGFKCIVCDNPWEVGALAGRFLRNKSKATFIGVTGSVGKTSTKEMVESVLRAGFGDELVASKGNSNTIYRVIEMINNLDGNEKVVLQEVCAGGFVNKKYNEPCEFIIGKSSKIYNADIAIYTNIKDSHIESFGSREKICEEKTKLSKYGNPHGLAIYNYDDKLLRETKFRQKSYSYSLYDSNADFYTENLKFVGGGTSFTIVDNVRNKKLKVKVKALGEQFAINAVVAYIVGKHFNMADETIAEGIKAYETSGERCNLFKAGHNWVYADCYNSSYDALKMILKSFSLTELKNNGRRIAVIGDIFELGTLSEETHIKCGELLAGADLDKVIFCGENSLLSYNKYKEFKDNCEYCKTQNELIEIVEKTIRPDDMILFKASHGMGFADVIDIIFGKNIGEKTALGHRQYVRKKDERFEYNVFNTHATIRGLIADVEEECVLPDEISGLPIGKLAFGLFKENQTVKSVKLPKNLSLIRPHCFENSTVENVIFNERIRCIGNDAFAGCNQLKRIAFPEGMMEISSRAFADCENLAEVVIPESVGRIKNTAFENSKNVVIVCKKDSYAEKYAEKNKIAYKID